MVSVLLNETIGAFDLIVYSVSLNTVIALDIWLRLVPLWSNPRVAFHSVTLLSAVRLADTTALNSPPTKNPEINVSPYMRSKPQYH